MCITLDSYTKQRRMLETSETWFLVHHLTSARKRGNEATQSHPKASITMSQSHGSFPCRIIKDLHASAPAYFKRPHNRDPGDFRVAFEPLLLTPQLTTLLVVRVTQRELVDRMQWSKGYGGRIYNSHADYYRGSGKSYWVIELTWVNGTIAELSQHWDLRSAKRALKLEHNSR